MGLASQKGWTSDWMPEMSPKVRGKTTNCFAGDGNMSQDSYSRILLWFCGFMGIFILAVPNQIRWIGLVFVFGGLFLDFQIWKDNKLEEGGKYGNIRQNNTSAIQQLSANRINTTGAGKTDG
jgi:hypothetical protein